MPLTPVYLGEIVQGLSEVRCQDRSCAGVGLRCLSKETFGLAIVSLVKINDSGAVEDLSGQLQVRLLNRLGQPGRFVESFQCLPILARSGVGRSQIAKRDCNDEIRIVASSKNGEALPIR